VAEQRARALRQRGQRAQRGAGLVERPGQPADPLRDRALARGGGLRDLRGLLDEVGHARAPLGQLADDGVGAGDGVAEPRAVTGARSMERAPISDWGAMRQSASALNGAKRPSSFIEMRARWSGVTRTSVTVPTFAPAMRTSWPGIRKLALSKIASTR